MLFDSSANICIQNASRMKQHSNFVILLLYAQISGIKFVKSQCPNVRHIKMGVFLIISIYNKDKEIRDNEIHTYIHIVIKRLLVLVFK